MGVPKKGSNSKRWGGIIKTLQRVFFGEAVPSKKESPALVYGVGVVTGGEAANSLTLPNNPETGSWHWIDTASVARHCNLPENTPFVEQVSIDEEAGVPRTAMQIAADNYNNRAPKKRPENYPEPQKRDQFLDFSVMPYDHLNYALTWGALSIATALLAYRLLRKGSISRRNALALQQ